MPIQTRYLFTAAMDGEHVPLLLKVPGVIAVARFKKQELTMVIGGERKTIVIENEPAYNALYEVDSPEVLLSAAWAKVVDAGRWFGEVRPPTGARKDPRCRQGSRSSP